MIDAMMRWYTYTTGRDKLEKRMESLRAYVRTVWRRDLMSKSISFFPRQTTSTGAMAFVPFRVEAIGTDAERNKPIRASSRTGHEKRQWPGQPGVAGRPLRLSPLPPAASSVRHHRSPVPLIVPHLREMPLRAELTGRLAGGGQRVGMRVFHE